MQFSFEVPESRIQEFLEYSSTALKKTWEANRCRSYTAFRTVTERVRSDQIVREKEIVEQLLFESIDDVRWLFDISNLKPDAFEAARAYNEKFRVGNMECRILEQVST